MYTTKGIEAIATITELRARTSELIDEAAKFEGIMSQKNNEPLDVLVSYKKYLSLIGAVKCKHEGHVMVRVLAARTLRGHLLDSSR